MKSKPLAVAILTLFSAFALWYHLTPSGDGDIVDSETIIADEGEPQLHEPVIPDDVQPSKAPRNEKHAPRVSTPQIQSDPDLTNVITVNDVKEANTQQAKQTEFKKQQLTKEAEQHAQLLAMRRQQEQERLIQEEKRRSLQSTPETTPSSEKKSKAEINPLENQQVYSHAQQQEALRRRAQQKQREAELKLALLEKKRQQELLKKKRDEQRQQELAQQAALEKARLEKVRKEAEEQRRKAALAKKRAEEKARRERERKAQLERERQAEARRKRREAQRVPTRSKAGKQVVAVDNDNDGSADTWFLYNEAGELTQERFILASSSGKRMVKAIFDLENRSKRDPYCLRRLESDNNNDGRLDDIVDFDGCQKARQRIDSNDDGSFDQWLVFAPSSDCLVSRSRDANANSRPDYWERYEKCNLVRREWDENENGVKEVIESLSPQKEWVHRIGFDARLKADVLYQNKKLGEAKIWYMRSIDEFEREWVKPPQRIRDAIAECHIKLGNIAFRTKQPDVIPKYERAIALGSNSVKSVASANLGHWYLGEKKYGRARAYYRTAQAYRFDDTRSLLNYIKLTLRMKNGYNDAVALLSQRLKKKEQSDSLRVRTLLLRATIHQRQGNLEKAKADREKARAIDPQMTRSLEGNPFLQSRIKK